MTDFLSMMLLGRTRPSPLGAYGRDPRPQPGGVSVEPHVRVGIIIDGREIDVETPPADPYHITTTDRDGWYFQEVCPDTLASRITEETAVNGVTWLRPASYQSWFPLPEGQVVAFHTGYYPAGDGWEHTLIWPDHTNVWRMQTVSPVAGGSAGTLVAPPDWTYHVLDESFLDGGVPLVLVAAASPLNNRTQNGRRIGVAGQPAMVCWTPAAAPNNCLVFLPAELRAWRADCP